MIGSSPRAGRVALLLIVAAVAAMFIATVRQGAPWSVEPPTHAQGGIFLGDLLGAWIDGRELPDSRTFRQRHPALPMPFVPSLFDLVAAASFSALGVTPLAASLAVSVFVLMLGLGAYRLARLWLGEAEALAVAVLLLAFPQVMLSSRQVAPDVPALALVVWGAVYLHRYVMTPRSILLYPAVGLIVLAVTCRPGTAFLLPILAWAFVRGRGFVRPSAWVALLVGALALVPALPAIFDVGAASVAGASDPTLQRWSADGWLWHLRQLPEQLGWAPLVAALIGFGWRLASPDPHLPGTAGLFLLGWFLLGYVQASAVLPRETVHAIFLLPPVAVAAAGGAAHLAARYLGGQGMRAPAALALAGLCLVRALVS